MPLSSLPAVLLQLTMHSLHSAELVALARCCKWTLLCADSPFAWRDCPPVPVSPTADLRSASTLVRHASFAFRSPLGLRVFPPPVLSASAVPLRILSFCCFEPDDSKLSYLLERLPMRLTLRSVTLQATASVALMRTLAWLPQLDTLRLESAMQTEACYLALQDAPRLTALHVEDSPRLLNGSCLPLVAQLPHLRRLSVRGAASTAAAFVAMGSALSSLSRLEALILDHWKSCRSLTRTELSSALQQLRALRELTLDRCHPRLIDLLLPSLPRAPSLALLSVRSQSLLGLASVLTAMPALRCRLDGLPVTAQGRGQWRSWIAKLQAQFRGRVCATLH